MRYAESRPCAALRSRRTVTIGVMLFVPDFKTYKGTHGHSHHDDNDLATILNMLVDEGYAEKIPDPQRQGWFLYRGTSQWLAFKDK